MKHYLGKIVESTLKNVNYREVLYTGPKMQLVVMALDPGEEIGEEIHAEHDQFFRFEAGEGKVVLDGVPHDISVGDVLIVPAGMRHNIINTSADSPMKLYTIYAPPEHRPETVHPRKQDEIA
ncbi:MAG: cupin domain-containing protein [Candidatus Moranbacteria bacterium]|nr:cupin domain-containing protein [Candidatus Moranbacteria bacterium]NTW75712.1 cupin domain-containing protein [Candidatus Moranbacteria bacterium]